MASVHRHFGSIESNVAGARMKQLVLKVEIVHSGLPGLKCSPVQKMDLSLIVQRISSIYCGPFCSPHWQRCW